jgi:hypothetical protein
MSRNESPFIPPRTRTELSSPAPQGQRHEQMKKIVLPLLGAGLTSDAVFVQLRAMYDDDVTDREIRDLIKWSIAKNPQPCGYPQKDHPATNIPTQPQRVTAEQAIANVVKWLGVHCCDKDPSNPLNGQPWRCDECDLWHVSPWRPLDDWRLDALPLLSALHDKIGYINVVTDFTTEEKDGSRKANPKGAGKTMLRDDWLRSIREHGAPQSLAGAWIRPNPVKQHGSGKNGAVCDSDVTSFRFCLLESDDLPLELQLSLWARLPLPIAAIIDSGGRSVHAWVRLDCDSDEEYQSLVGRIYTRLAQFGLCLSNKNASRLSRLPGAQRAIGKRDDDRQRLLYLNPEPLEAPIFPKALESNANG